MDHDTGSGRLCPACDGRLYPVSAYAAVCMASHGWVLLPGAPLERDDRVAAALEGIAGWAVLA